MSRKWILFGTVVAIVAGVPLLAAAKGKTEPVTLRTVTMACNQGGCHGDGPFCCTADQGKLQEAVQAVPGVKNVSLDRKMKIVSLKYEVGKLDLKALVAAAEQAGFGSPKL